MPLKGAFKGAFSMAQMVIVIAIIAIFSAFAVVYYPKNELKLAAQQVANDIAYTQYLALTDDKFSGERNWFLSRWQIFFQISEASSQYWTYSVFSDSRNNKQGNADMAEIAHSPKNPAKLLTGGPATNKNKPDDHRYDFTLRIGERYGIVGVELLGECGGGTSGGDKSQRVAFDELGRPHSGKLSNNKTPFDTLLKEPCVIELTHKTEGKACISIAPFSGRISVGGC